MSKFKSKIEDINYQESNSNNEDWWNKNPMTYDWDENLGPISISPEYLKKIDDLFGQGHSLVNNPNWPSGKILEKFIPYQLFENKKILEIGCGAGLVSSHIAKSGAKLTAIDITSNSINFTKKRFKFENLNANIIKMDAENVNFEDNYFDYIVSWGVIHHSGNMKKILSEIYRVLKPGGKAYIMVYNKKSIRYQVYCRIWLGVFKLQYLKKSLEEIAGDITDGYIARHLTIEQFNEISQNFTSKKFSFSDEKTTILKYLFGIGFVFRYFSIITRPIEIFLAKRWGWYLEVELKK